MAVAQAWIQSGGDVAQVHRLLAEQLGRTQELGSSSKAFVHGVAVLAEYAASEWPIASNAIDAEREALEVSRRVVRPLLQSKLQRRVDELDAELVGAAVCDGCGETLQSQGRRSRGWNATLGPLELKRRYVYCEPCERGQAPAQRMLGLPEGAFTARLEEAATMMATTVPHAMAVGLLEKLCGVKLSVKAIEDMVERRATEVQRRDREQAQHLAPFDSTGLPVPQQQRPTDAVASSAAPKVAYLEVDGVVPITREELTGEELTAEDHQRQQQAKSEKARGGKARRYRIVGREVKNAVLYEDKDCVAESPGRGCLLEKTYVSHLGDWASFAVLLWVQMLRLRFEQAELLVVLSDGAEWVRSLCKWLPIPVLLILDLFHVKHRIWEVANALYGEHTPQAAQWARIQCDRIERGRAEDVIQTLRFTRPRRAKVKELLDKLRGYLEDNLDRMDYPAYRARGLRVGSGAVESANYHVTGSRLKLQGMRWSAEGAGHMAILRADLFNGWWEARSREMLAS